MRAKSSGYDNAFSFNREGFIFPKISKKRRSGCGASGGSYSHHLEKGFFSVSLFLGGESRFNLVADVAISGEQAGSASGLTVPDKRSAPS